jgi:hypothetical protein
MGSAFLFAQPSAIAGVGRMLDFAGAFDAYNVSATGDQADAMATFLDWRTVGGDLIVAMESHEHAHAAPPAQLALALDEE